MEGENTPAQSRLQRAGPSVATAPVLLMPPTRQLCEQMPPPILLQQLRQHFDRSLRAPTDTLVSHAEGASRPSFADKPLQPPCPSTAPHPLPIFRLGPLSACSRIGSGSSGMSTSSSQWWIWLRTRRRLHPLLHSWPVAHSFRRTAAPPSLG